MKIVSPMTPLSGLSSAHSLLRMNMRILHSGYFPCFASSVMIAWTQGQSFGSTSPTCNWPTTTATVSGPSWLDGWGSRNAKPTSSLDGCPPTPYSLRRAVRSRLYDVAPPLPPPGSCLVLVASAGDDDGIFPAPLMRGDPFLAGSEFVADAFGVARCLAQHSCKCAGSRWSLIRIPFVVIAALIASPSLRMPWCACTEIDEARELGYLKRLHAYDHYMGLFGKKQATPKLSPQDGEAAVLQAGRRRGVAHRRADGPDGPAKTA
ncbi:unannotated protein [freshwater metagenome]|uniref:Unannotated protein n=1 Tax=freshwater metagenome TaxID=449393 RepID=A0A6J7LMA9_9ZZZZ